ncbi:hypothetical protein [Christiangramia sp. SM2212]|uniref:Uncharacterized protein n=1 Tax=Christiangramia sediminicola TaxID=3073267 RepID=A0ABU1EQJ9_9FLAO|nr:hypothetical protein [Christiangramia sp. SM2212]MDR5590665.1 hypothetical protein [Christiangramia sp. SM2212]
MEKPEKCISISRAKEIQKEWWNTRLEVTTNGKTHEDTCEFHFTLDELQQYLDYVREKSEEANISNPGINIWLGAYKEKENRPNLTTIFLSATKKKNSVEDDGSGRDYEENTEIDPFNENGGLWPPFGY